MVTDGGKEDVAHTYNGILLSNQKKSEVLPFTTTWMDPEGVMLSQRERKILCDLAYTWNVKNKENE